MKVIDEFDYESEVLDSTLPVVVEFSAPWCSICSMIEDDFIALAEKYAEKVKFVRLDVSRSEEFALELGINFVPSFFIYKGGKPESKLISQIDVKTLEAKLKTMI